jgi:hypothetical protein
MPYRQALFIEKVIIHNQAVVKRHRSYLWDKIYYLAKQKEVLVAENRLENFDFLNLCIVIDNFRILQQNFECFLLGDLMVERGVELDGNRPELLGVCNTLVIVGVLETILAELDEVGHILENEIAVPIVDYDAQLVLVHVLPDVFHREHHDLPAFLMCGYSLAVVD